MTLKKGYPSRYSPKKEVHAAQYITELICEKKAKYDKTDLPVKFWELKHWGKFYKYQIMLANGLIKEFGEDAVIMALKDNRTFKTYSLRSPFLKKIIKEMVEKLTMANSAPKKDIQYDFRDKHSSSMTDEVKSSLLNKLEELE